MKKSFVYIFIGLTFLGACKNEGTSNKGSETQVLEIFSTKGDEKSMEKGDLKYFESVEYNRNQKKSTTYYDAAGNVKGKEIFEFTSPSDSLPIGAKYYDVKDVMLSYYKYVNNEKGQLVASYAFDASSHELLKIENYTYRNGNLYNKRILEGDYTPSRRYVFQYDSTQNEIGFIVYNAKDSLMGNEEFRITKKDKNNKWTEKWGFSNGKPVTLHVRSGKNIK
jgi:hypothetical protein